LYTINIPRGLLVIKFTAMHPALLFISSSQNLREDLPRQLEYFGHKNIDWFPEVKEAIHGLSEKDYSLAIVDVEDQDSLEATRAALSLKSNEDLPLILLGARDDSGIHDKIRELRPRAYISKPVSWLDLAIAIDNILEDPATNAARAKESWQTLLNNLPGLAYRCLDDQSWTMLFLSRGCRELTGYAPADLVLNQKISYQELIHPHDQTMVREQIEKSKMNQFELTYRIRTKGGQYKWVLERGIKTRQKWKGVAILEGVIVDIDEKMQAEMRLKLSLKELKILNSLNARANVRRSMPNTLAKTVQDLDKNYGISTNLYFLDEDNHKLVGQNRLLDSPAMKSLEQFLGQSIHEITIDLVEGSWHYQVMHGSSHYFTTDPKEIAKMARDFLTNSNLKELMPQVSEKMQVKSALGIKLTQEDRILGLMAIRSSFVLSEQEVKSILTVSEGISNMLARRSLEQRLRKEEGRFRTLWEMAPNGIVIIDPEGIVKSVNKSLLKMTGFSESEFLNKHIGELPMVPEDSIDEYLDLFSRLMTRSRSKPIEFPWVHKNGTLNWGEAHVSFTKENGEVTGIQAIISDITRRRTNEIKIKESEDLYRTVISKSPMPILLIQHGTVTFANPIMKKLMGKNTSGKLIGKSALEMVAPEYRNTIAQRLKALENSKPNKPAIFKMNREDQEVFLETSSVPVVIQGEHVSLVMGRDITGQIMVEEKLRENEKLLSSILQAAPIGIGLVKKRVFYWANDYFVKMVGHGRKELIGRNSSMIYPSTEIYEKAGQVKYSKLKKDNIGQVETKFLRKNGNEMDVLLSSVFLDPDNPADGTIFTALDITQKKASERILKENEERYRTLFENMAQGVYYQSSDGKLLDVNKAALRMLGLTRSQFLGKTTPPHSWRFVDEKMEEIREEDFPANVSLRTGRIMEDVVIGTLNPMLKKYVWLLVNTQPQLLPGESKPYQVFVTLHDLTDIKNAEMELNKSYQEIKMLSRRTEEIREEERKQIARNLHDELGQILTAIKMDVGWVKNQLPEDERKLNQKIAATSEIIDQAIAGIQQITTQLRPPILDNLGLYEALKSLLAGFQERTGIIARIQLPEKESALHPDLKISLYRIAQESLTNVIRHSKASKVGLTISEKNNNLELQIEDDGLGIKDENIRASDSLGLIGIKERVLRWNGQFEITGSDGDGTLLRIKIPIIRKNEIRN
jgi:PAS domain S-box-containing protein